MRPELNHAFSISRQNDGFAQFDLCDQFLELKLCVFKRNEFHNSSVLCDYEEFVFVTKDIGFGALIKIIP